jgi:lipopolysaccharide/colanic/teichoic acid biosynthesis glycosyltransferase
VTNLDTPDRAKLTVVVKRLFDFAAAALLLGVFAIFFLACAVVIKLESPGPIFYRSRRVGRHGRQFQMFKFRKMWMDATGPPLTSATDERFTRFGGWLARTKVDELPQLWNVLRGEMSLVGPRPEEPSFVAANATAFAPVLAVKPGMTGLCQLAFARESAVLDRGDPAQRVENYLEHILPQKIAMDVLYARRQNLLLDLRILLWTVVCVIFRQEVAVHRGTGELSRRRRLSPQPEEGLAKSQQAIRQAGDELAATEQTSA